MIKNLSNNQEFNNFSSIADEWWIPEGKFKILHDITPLRIEYIIKIFGRKKLYKTNILDLGCGGGLTCEPLYRLGGNITGVDFFIRYASVCCIILPMQTTAIKGCSFNIPLLQHMMMSKIPSSRRMLAVL